MKKILFVAIVVLLLSLSLVNAITQQEINEAKSLIDSKVDCKSLSESQLEIIGEYYMEQMHPGEAHELMHKMMDLKEGSETEEQFHINMARVMYCGEGGMMGSGGMMGGNMMSGQNPIQTNMMQGMMGNYGFGWNVWGTLYVILIIGLIILIYFGIINTMKTHSKLKGSRVKKENNILLIVIILLVLLFSFGWGFGYMGGMMFFGPIFMVLVLVLIVWLIVSLTQRK